MLNITGYVTATLSDKDGNVIQREEGKNTVVQMSNNILMDAILPRLGTANSPTSAPERAEGTNMTDNTTFPSGADYVGPAGAATNTSAAHAINSISYIAVGSNVGTTSAGTAHLIANQNNDVDTHGENASHQVSMVDANYADPFSAFTAQGDSNTGSKFVRKVDSITFPAYNKIRFTTTFGLTEGNITNGIAEIGLWTAGNNIDSGNTDNGFVTASTPTTTTNMRLFARKVLSSNTITKTNDGTLEISYTITFN